MNALNLDSVWWDMHQIYIRKLIWSHNEIKDEKRECNLSAAFSGGGPQVGHLQSRKSRN